MPNHIQDPSAGPAMMMLSQPPSSSSIISIEVIIAMNSGAAIKKDKISLRIFIGSNPQFGQDFPPFG
jgi:hypothetical protein